MRGSPVVVLGRPSRRGIGRPRRSCIPLWNFHLEERRSHGSRLACAGQLRARGCRVASREDSSPLEVVLRSLREYPSQGPRQPQSRRGPTAIGLESAPICSIRWHARRKLDRSPGDVCPSAGIAQLSTVYHLGQERWGDAFTRDLGLVMQAYVGEQFNLMHPEGVLPDVEYRPSQRAVDFVIVLPDIVLLVEVKSARVAVPGRLNLGSFVRDVERDVGKAFRQISHTSRLITDGHQAFASVPPNRPLRGAVITAEPHHLINATAIRANLPQPAVPTVVLGLGEFEELIEECASRPGPHWLAVTDIPANDAASVRR